jgi:hypothetical protein
MKTYDMKSAGLDKLEKELGLLDIDDLLSQEAATQSRDTLTAQSAQISHQRTGGIISTLWLCGVFGGCLPPVCALWLTDWALLQKERYYGYITVFVSSCLLCT